MAIAATLVPAMAAGEASVQFGRRWLDEGTWSPLESPTLYGVSVDVGRESWPVRLEAGYLVSFREEDDIFPLYGEGSINATIEELSFGLLGRWRVGGLLRLHLGGGAAFFIETVDVNGHGPSGRQHDDAGSPGAYAHAGADLRIGSRFSVGLDARKVAWTKFTRMEDHYSDPKRTFEGDADYFQVTLLAGWRWPRD